MAKDLDSLPRLRIHGTIAPRDHSQLLGDVFSAADVIDFLEANVSAPEILVEISSNGGSVSEGKEIYTRLKTSGKKITTLTYKAGSIATLFMLVGQKRLIAENADFCIHQAGLDPKDLPQGRLLAADFAKISQEIAEATTEMLDIYCKAVGEDKRSILITTMARDSNGGAREAVKLGFANGYYDRVKQTALVPITITAHISELINNNMAQTDLLKAIEKSITDGFKAITGKLKLKAEVMLPLAAGGNISSDAVDDTGLVKSNVKTVDDAGVATTTPVADGEYPLADGRTVVVLAGVITEIRDALDAKKLQEENAALKSELEALKGGAAAAEAKAKTDLATAAEAHKKEIDTFKTETGKQINALKTEFDNYKKQIPGDKDKDDKPELVVNIKKSINDIRAELEASKLK